MKKQKTKNTLHFWVFTAQLSASLPLALPAHYLMSPKSTDSCPEPVFPNGKPDHACLHWKLMWGCLCFNLHFPFPFYCTFLHVLNKKWYWNLLSKSTYSPVCIYSLKFFKIKIKLMPVSATIYSCKFPLSCKKQDNYIPHVHLLGTTLPFHG